MKIIFFLIFISGLVLAKNIKLDEVDVLQAQSSAIKSALTYFENKDPGYKGMEVEAEVVMDDSGLILEKDYFEQLGPLN